MKEENSSQSDAVQENQSELERLSKEENSGNNDAVQESQSELEQLRSEMAEQFNAVNQRIDKVCGLIEESGRNADDVACRHAKWLAVDHAEVVRSHANSIECSIKHVDDMAEMRAKSIEDRVRHVDRMADIRAKSTDFRNDINWFVTIGMGVIIYLLVLVIMFG